MLLFHSVRIRSISILILFAVITYLWLGYAMIVCRSPMLAMLVYYPVFCLGGGLILRRSISGVEGKSIDVKRHDNPVLLTFLVSILATAVLWACTLLFRPGMIDPEIIGDGLDSIGMQADKFWIAAGFLALVNPFAEEFLWRGSVFEVLLKSGSRTRAVILSSILFAGYHPLVISMIFPGVWLIAVFIITFIGGMFLSELFLRTGKLQYPIALHIVININLMIMGYLYAPSSTP